MKKPYPLFCVNCKWSIQKPGTILLECSHPIVCRINGFALGTTTKVYEFTRCDIERNRWLLGDCGRRGRLWEAKEEDVKNYKEEDQSPDR